MYSLSLAIALMVNSASAQQPSFIEPAGNATLTPQQHTILTAIKSTPSTQEVKLIRLHPAILRNSDRVWIPLNSDHSVWIKNSSREYRGDNLISWIGSGSDGKENTAAIAINGDNVTATIQTAEGLYRIRPLGNGLHTLIKVDAGHVPAEHPPSPQGNKRDGLLTAPKGKGHSLPSLNFG